jgi:hypothetical protein
VVGDLLNRSGRFPHYVGPIGWDIVAEDWECWRQGLDPEIAARQYTAEAERVGGGIVLMHDSSEEDDVCPRNRTWELTRLLVPMLKSRGFRFVRLDEVPQVVSATRVSYQVTLHLRGGSVLSRPDGEQTIRKNGAEQDREAFGVVELGGSRVALRAGNGCYLWVGPDGVVRARATELTAEQAFVFEPRGGGFALRCSGGEVLACDDGGRLGTAAAGCRAVFAVRRLFA